MEQVKALITPDKVLLSIFMALLWGLFTVPFILFYSEGLEMTNMTDFSGLQMMANMTDSSELQITNTSEETNMSCPEDFYFEESKNYCVPDCYHWTSYSPVQTRAVDAMIIISCCVAILSVAAVLVISCIRRKTVLKFPSVLVVYLSLTSLLFYSTILVGYMNRYELYCSSRDIEENLLKPTPYCLFSGTVFHFRSIKMLILWLSHVVVLFFMIYFPLQAKRFLSSRKVHYVHAAIVMVGFLVPTIPPLVTLLAGIRNESDIQRLGYRVIIYPPYICFNVQRDIEFYAINVPSNVMLTTGVTFLLLIFWKLYKQRHRVEKSQISTTETKILVSFTYFTLLHITTSTLTVHYNNTAIEFGMKLFSYFACGRYSEHCSKPDLADTYHPIGWIISWVVNACLPIFLLVYVINCEMLKRDIKKKRDTIRNMSEVASSKTQTAG